MNVDTLKKEDTHKNGHRGERMPYQSVDMEKKVFTRKSRQLRNSVNFLNLQENNDMTEARTGKGARHGKYIRRSIPDNPK
jgi:hypothetical protein